MYVLCCHICYFVDWGGWSSITDAGESNMSIDSFQKQEDSNMSLVESKSGSVYGGSNVGVGVVNIITTNDVSFS